MTVTCLSWLEKISYFQLFNHSAQFPSPASELCNEENTFLSFVLLSVLEVDQVRFSNLDVYREESERHGLFNECPVFQGFLSMHCPFPFPGK